MSEPSSQPPVPVTAADRLLATRVPRRMRSLPRDRRGYPIPVIIMRDTDNQAHFAINDSRKQEEMLFSRRCPICGEELDPILWFAGGPLSAFHIHGAYSDTAMHHQCLTYAMRVCPYLAAGRYDNRVDAGTLSPDKAEDGLLLLDHTQIAVRPKVFVVVAARGQSIKERGRPIVPSVVIPDRPYAGVEFWSSGEKISSDVGIDLILQEEYVVEAGITREMIEEIIKSTR